MANIEATSSEYLRGATLFPILPSGPSGLARLAAEATHADDGHLIEFKAMQARSILNHSVSKRMGRVAWSINPYRGCEFGCKYCYARYTHEFLRPEPVAEVPKGAFEAPQQGWALAFEREIYLKENAAWLLEQELRKIDPAQEIAIGTATDPYQPIERRVGITRSLLEVLAKREGLRIGIVTKSRLIERDVDLLRAISQKNHLVVHLTITTTDAKLARLLEPRAPRPDLRFGAVKKLREAGIVTGVLCSPLLYGLNDSVGSVEEVARRAREAGASFLGGHPLFLKSCSRPTYLSFVREHFPHLLTEYERRFATMDFADGEYRQAMAARIRGACRKFGLAERSTDALLTRDVGSAGAVAARGRLGPAPVRPSRQAALFA
jgi:DNA repair photolyase